MPKIVSVEAMRAIEAATDAAGISYDKMMDHAGRAAAELIKDRIWGAEQARVLILVGPGNNGGDGLVAGRLVAQETDAEVCLYLLKPRDDANFEKAKEAGLQITAASDDQGGKILRRWLNEADVIVDALLGTGARLPIKGAMAGLLKETGRIINARRRPAASVYHTPAHPAALPEPVPLVIAIDSPSGLACDTGELDPVTLQADDTITFAAVKRGQVTFPGAARLGRLHVAGIGTPPDLPALNEIKIELADGPGIRAMLPERPANSHKGTFGSALIVAGSLNYVGAAALAARGAYRSGAGLVTVAAPQPVVAMLTSQIAEATWLYLPHDMGVLAGAAAEVLREETDDYQAMLLGPGWGAERETQRFLEQLLKPIESQKKRNIGFMPQQPGDEGKGEADARLDLPPLVIDADGLNLLASMDTWALPPGAIITPHPGEMARLTGQEVADIQADRITTAQEQAQAWDCVVVLKGAYTVVAAPDGRTMVMPFATSAMASAGMGDVLAGVIVGLRAQGLEPFEAAAAGAYLHGLAGGQAERLWAAPGGVVAGDVADLLPEAMAIIMGRL